MIKACLSYDEKAQGRFFRLNDYATINGPNYIRMTDWKEV
ncbi:hypothetical protein ADIAL_0512 [Alkalibacterium sp. AK22]|nr:hypothetical protein ADIAL_0512 [Alkalibacterium sp. AK22]